MAEQPTIAVWEEDGSVSWLTAHQMELRLERERQRQRRAYRRQYGDRPQPQESA